MNAVIARRVLGDQPRWRLRQIKAMAGGLDPRTRVAYYQLVYLAARWALRNWDAYAKYR